MFCVKCKRKPGRTVVVVVVVVRQLRRWVGNPRLGHCWALGQGPCLCNPINIVLKQMGKRYR